MDPDRFDALVRFLSAGRPRRAMLRGMAGAVGLTIATRPDLTRARKGKKKKKPKLKLNAFGCLNVGQKCRGHDGRCCSGRCQGRRPRRGKRDRSRCVAHDAATCQTGQTIRNCGGVNVACTSSAGRNGRCVTTTGNAPYCEADGRCFACKKDADCEPFCGPGAACIPCAGECLAQGGTACVGVFPCNFPPNGVRGL